MLCYGKFLISLLYRHRKKHVENRNLYNKLVKQTKRKYKNKYLQLRIIQKVLGFNEEYGKHF